MGWLWWWLWLVSCDDGWMLVVVDGGWLWYWADVVVVFFFFFFLILKRGWERVWQGKGEEREKKIIYKATVTMNICMVTVSILHTCKVMQSFTSTDADYFMLYCANFYTFCILHPLVRMLLVYVWFQIKKSAYFTIQLIFATIHGPHYTFWYYLWVSLYYFS